jgi:hypothetical protein
MCAQNYKENKIHIKIYGIYKWEPSSIYIYIYVCVCVYTHIYIYICGQTILQYLTRKNRLH